MRATYPPTNYPEGTTVIEAETGTFTQPGTPVNPSYGSWKLARPYGDPWASSGKMAYLYGQGAAVQYANVPQASKLMIRYSAGGKRYMSIYVNGSLALAHYELPAISVPKLWGMAIIPVAVPAGATLKIPDRYGR
ncbi:MAG: hypothetical protein IMW89_21265 [Ktedonobacteraceae bacterium]|nr:hypothetical protein [Ktedonobacteraceae bacterium]